MARNVLIDSCYWMGLFNARDQHFESAQKIEPSLSIQTMLLPWPTLFEFVDTRLLRREEDCVRFRKYVFGERVELVDDTPYRPSAVATVLDNPWRGHSLTDFILRSMIEDVNLSIDTLVTSNGKDFHDVCAKHRVELVILERREAGK